MPEMNGIAREQIKGIKELCQERHQRLDERMHEMEEQVKDIAESAKDTQRMVRALDGKVTRILTIAAVLWFFVQVLVLPELKEWIWR